MIENLKDDIKGKNKTALVIIIFVILLLTAGYTRAEDIDYSSVLEYLQ